MVEFKKGDIGTAPSGIIFLMLLDLKWEYVYRDYRFCISTPLTTAECQRISRGLDEW